MDVEKAATKGHGFFILFDWGKNKKSKKRLFSGGGSESYSLNPCKQMSNGSQSGYSKLVACVQRDGMRLDPKSLSSICRECWR
jgi:hypothetical protein